MSGTTIHTRCSKSFSQFDGNIGHNESTVDLLNKLETLTEKLIVLHEQSLAQRSLEMNNIKEWLNTMKEDRIQMTESISRMVEILATTSNRNSSEMFPPSGPNFHNCNCHYAGVYFVHN